MGKYSILLVFTLSVMLAILLPSINKLGHHSLENYVEYASSTQAHNLAASGANVAVNKFYLDPTWRAGLSNMPLAGGTYNVTAKDYGTNQVQIVSIGSFDKVKDTVTVLVQPVSFAHYAYYSKVEGNIYWVTGDTVTGPVHSQDVLKISGSPVFKGHVSAKLGTNPKKSSAQFQGGYIAGEDIDLPLDFHEAENAATSGGKVFASGDVWLTFKGSTVDWKTTSGGTITTTSISTMAPNGVIVAAKGNMHIKGTLSGRLTLCAEGTSPGGNIYIEDDMKYTTDPRYGTSTDMLGLLTQNGVIITDNSANNNSVIVQASILCRTGGMSAENYSTRGVAGTLDLLGGLVMYQRGAVGTFGNGSIITSGFRKDYIYDTRLYLQAPPFFPGTGKFQIVSWVE